VRKTTKVARLAAALITVSLIGAACGSSDDEATEEAPVEETTAVSYPTSLDDCANVTYDYAKPATTGGMTITYDINPDAVWDDGSPITVADFRPLVMIK
jgi:ABC-type oligopeptide transport system substrate-binding subunit